LLAGRLAKHGLILSAAALAAALAHGTAAAHVPAALLWSTVQATTLLAAAPGTAGAVAAPVATLTQGVLQAMFLTQLKSVIASLTFLAVIGAGVGTLWQAAAPLGAQPQQEQKQVPPGKAIKDDGQAKLQQEIERLRAELEKARLELAQARAEIAVLKAQADLARAQAEVALAQAQREAARAAEAAAKAKAAQVPPKLPKPSKDEKPEVPANPAAAVSPDGRIFAAAVENAITLIDLQTGKTLFKATGHTGMVMALAFSPDGKRLVSGGQDKAAHLWDVPTGKELRRFIVGNPVSKIGFSEDGRTLLITDSANNRHEFDIATGKAVRVVSPEGETTEEKRP
jgi:hypothetical protein